MTSEWVASPLDAPRSPVSLKKLCLRLLQLYVVQCESFAGLPKDLANKLWQTGSKRGLVTWPFVKAFAANELHEVANLRGITPDALNLLMKQHAGSLKVLSLSPFSTTTTIAVGTKAGGDPSQVPRLSGLPRLTVSLSLVKKLTNLETLDLSFCRFEPASFKHLSTLKQLKTLAVAATKIDGTALPIISEMRALTALNLSRCLMIPQEMLRECISQWPVLGPDLLRLDLSFFPLHDLSFLREN